MYNSWKSRNIIIVICLLVSIILVCGSLFNNEKPSSYTPMMPECLVLEKQLSLTRDDWEFITTQFSNLDIGQCDTQKQQYDILTDWVMSLCTYDYTYTHNNAHTAIADGLTCCHGYADLTHVMCTLASIPHRELWGYTTDNVYHAWMQVCIDGTWYYSDISTYDIMLEEKPICKLIYGQPYLSKTLFTYIDTITEIKE